jgi:hypothetical protein
VAYFKDGQGRRSYSAADGLGGGRVEALQFDRDGAVWAATEGGLSRIKDGRIATLSSRNELPCEELPMPVPLVVMRLPGPAPLDPAPESAALPIQRLDLTFLIHTTPRDRRSTAERPRRGLSLRCQSKRHDQQWAA